MTETADRINREFTGGKIDWWKVDEVNAKIGETWTREELLSLLRRYAIAINGQTCE